MTARADWLRARRAGIGGSDAAALLDCHPYMDLVSLWANKTGRLAPDEDNARLRWGRRLEAAILDEYAHATGFEVLDGAEAVPDRVASIEGVSMLQHPDLPIMIGNTDAMARDNAAALGVVDAKTVMWMKFRDWIRQGRPDMNYLVQLEHYMEITGAKWGAVAAFTGLDEPLYIYEVERDTGFAERLMEVEDTFWRRYIVRDQQPPSNGSKASAKALRAAYPKDNGQFVQLTGPAVEWADQFDELTTEIKTLEGERDVVKTKLIATIGEAVAGRLPDGDGFTFKTGKRGRSLRRASARAMRKLNPGTKT